MSMIPGDVQGNNAETGGLGFVFNISLPVCVCQMGLLTKSGAVSFAIALCVQGYCRCLCYI